MLLDVENEMLIVFCKHTNDMEIQTGDQSIVKTWFEGSSCTDPCWRNIPSLQDTIVHTYHHKTLER